MTLWNTDSLNDILLPLCSTPYVQIVKKLSTVFGVLLPNKPKTISSSNYLSPIYTFIDTLWVTSASDAFSDKVIFNRINRINFIY